LSCIDPSVFILNDDLIQKLGIVLESKFLYFNLVFRNKLIEEVILFTDIEVLPVIHVGDTLPNEFTVVDDAHDITYLVEIILSL
jgi:hypothetical protein